MKRRFNIFLATLLICLCAFAQEKQENSVFLFEYATNYTNNNINVFLNLIDGKINEEKPFSYYQNIKNKKTELSNKDLKKEFKLKLKKNKKLGEACYYIIINGFKDYKISANYSDHSKNTTVFLRKDNAWQQIDKVFFVYKDVNEEKLEKIQLKCKHIPLGKPILFELKK